MSPELRRFMRVSGVAAMALFFIPIVYFVKYAAFDEPRERKLIAAYTAAQNGRSSLETAGRFDTQRAWLTQRDPDRIPLLIHVVSEDPDPALRNQAAITLGEMLLLRDVSMKRPIEAVQGKAALATAAAHDTDPAVQASARTAIDAIAAGGAVLRR